MLQPVPHIYGDKMPFLYLNAMAEIANAFPGVRFLLTLRDGRAVIASQIRHYHMSIERGIQPESWMKPTVRETEFLWMRSARKWLSLRANPPAPCMEVRYEAATRSSAELAERICDFVGMQYREEEFREFLAKYQPVNTETWRNEIPNLEQQLSDEFCEALGQLGYGN